MCNLSFLPRALQLLALLAFPGSVNGSLIGHWPLDELSGSTAFDASGFGNNGQNAGGGLNWEIGVVGGAARLDGSSAAGHDFEISAIPQMTGAQALTISCWIKPDSNNSYKGIFMTRDVNDSRGSGRNWGLARESGEHIDGRVSGAAIDSGNGSAPAGEWTHLALVWDESAKTRRLYINGTANPSSAITTSTPTSITNSGVWYIGWDPSSAGRRFPGTIDDLAVWNEALTPGEINTIYLGGLEGLNAPAAMAGDPPPVSRDYYVSPAGDNSNDGSIGSPFETVSRAMQFARPGDTVFLRAGTYREKVSLGRSGTADKPITIRAFGNETVVVTTADLVNGWTLLSGDVNGDGNNDSDIWSAPVSWDAGQDGVGNTLFVDGDLKFEARQGAENDPIEFSNWGQIPHRRLTLTGFRPDDLSGWGDDFWTGAKVRHHVTDWVITESTIADYQSSNGEITFQTPLGSTSQKHVIGYSIFDTIKALNLPGEWFKNRNTNTLYYKASPGQDPNSLQMAFKKRDYCFDVRGTDHIVIAGIECRGGIIETDGNTDYNVWKDNRFYAYDKGNFGRGFISGTNNVFRDNEVSQIWGSVATVSGSRHQIVNNYLHDIGYFGTSRVLAMNGEEHLVSHNTVRRFARSFLDGFPLRSEFCHNLFEEGGKLSWDTGVFDGDAGRGNGGGCIVHHNVFRNIDPVGIYMGFYSGTELTIHHNIIHDFIGTTTMRTGFLSFLKYYHNTFIGPAPLDGRQTDVIVSSSYHNNLQLTLDEVARAGLETRGNHNYSSGDFVDFVGEDFRLASGSAAIDRGIVIPGINDGYSGAAPDAGALEFGETIFDFGHDFSNPPHPGYSWFPVSGANVAQNGQFNQSPDNWTFINTPTWFYGNTWNGGGLARRGNRCILLEPGDGVSREFTGLQPDTRYTFGSEIRLVDIAFEAEDHDASSQGLVNFSSHRGENYIDGLNSGDWLRYDGIDFGFTGKYDQVELLYALPPLAPIGNESAQVELRLGSPSGSLLGTFAFNTLALDTWFASTIEIPDTGGIQTVYLVASGTVVSDLRLGSVRFKNSNVLPGYQVETSVLNFGNESIVTYSGESDWKNQYETLSFQTGPASTSARILIRNTGIYDAHFDSFALFEDPGTSSNVAANASASQSSNLAGNFANLAVNSLGPIDAAVTQSEPNSWWQVDLGQSRLISAIKLLPPLSGPGGLNNFRLSLWNSDPNQGGSPLWENDYAPTASPLQGEALYIKSLDNGINETLLGDVSARFVRVELAGIGNLGLGDVQVISSDQTDLVRTDAEISASSSTWQASFSHLINYGEMIITNRDDSLYQELSNFTLSIWDRPPGEGGVTVWQKTYFPTGSVGQGGSFIVRGDEIGSDGETRLASVLGRFVQIANAGINAAGNNILSLDNVVIHNAETVPPASNIALLGTATQSSDFYSTWGKAGAATNSIILPLADFTSTTSESSPWWEIELRENASIEQIVIFNRTDAASRIGNFRVSVLNDSRSEIWGQNYSYSNGDLPAGGSLTINESLSEARYVRVQISGSNILSLVEVQLWESGTTSLRLDPAQTTYRFDLGPSMSPTQSGWIGISPGTNGDVWWQYPVKGADQGPISGVNSINRDFITSDQPSTLNIKLPYGLWEITINMGEQDNAHDDVMVWLEDQLVSANIDLPAMQYSYLDFTGASPTPASIRVAVLDGELNIRLDDLGGNNPSWLLNRLSASRLSDDTDSDNDGISDLFEFIHYGHLTSNTDGSGDLDGDRASDLSEFIAGTDPLNSSSFFRILSSNTAPVQDSSNLNIVLTWASVSGKQYSVWKNSTLRSEDWELVTSGIPAAPGSQTSHGFQVSGNHYFFRIGVQNP